MKKTLICVLTIILCLFAAVSVSAASTEHTVKDVTFSLGDSYDLLTEEDLLVSSSVEGLIFAAISKDEAHQIQCRETVTDFSKELGSFKGLLGEDLAPVGQILFPDGYDTAEIGHNVFLKKSTANGEQFTVIYVTVSNGKLYTFTYFGNDPLRIGEFMGTVTLPDSATESEPNLLMIIFLCLGIAAFIALIVVLALSFIKDYRRRKMEQSDNIVSNYIKIKRRKY